MHYSVSSSGVHVRKFGFGQNFHAHTDFLDVVWVRRLLSEWLFHSAVDNLATAFKMSSKSFSYGSKTYNRMEFGFGRSGYHSLRVRQSRRKRPSLHIRRRN
jgi:uncharacterized protein YndB with AHSA1/START domain